MGANGMKPSFDPDPRAVWFLVGAFAGVAAVIFVLALIGRL